jgi:hypothetical protein
MRGNMAHSCLLKASFTCVDGLPESEDTESCMIQLHDLQPQAANLSFSSQTSSLGMEQFPTLRGDWLVFPNSYLRRSEQVTKTKIQSRRRFGQGSHGCRDKKKAVLIRKGGTRITSPAQFQFQSSTKSNTSFTSSSLARYQLVNSNVSFQISYLLSPQSSDPDLRPHVRAVANPSDCA